MARDLWDMFDFDYEAARLGRENASKMHRATGGPVTDIWMYRGKRLEELPRVTGGSMSATPEELVSELHSLGLDAQIRSRNGDPFILVYAETNTGNVPDATVWSPGIAPSDFWCWGHQFEHQALGDTDAAVLAARIKETL